MAFNYKTEYARYKKYYQSLEPKLSKPKNQQYTAVVFSFLAVSLFGWYAIRPTIQTILFLRREIQDKTVVNQKMEEKISHLIEGYALYQQIESQLPIIDAALPIAADILPFAQQLRNLASAQGVILQNVQTSETPIGQTTATPSGTVVKQQRLIDVPVVLVVSGPFASIKAFIQGLYDMRRISTIESLEFQPLRTAAQSVSTESAQVATGNVQVTIQAKVYYLSD